VRPKLNLDGMGRESLGAKSAGDVTEFPTDLVAAHSWPRFTTLSWGITK